MTGTATRSPAEHIPGRRWAPCQGTLFFAGEATDASGFTGSVHGAIASGKRAARQMIST